VPPPGAIGVGAFASGFGVIVIGDTDEGGASVSQRIGAGDSVMGGVEVGVGDGPEVEGGLVDTGAEGLSENT